MIANRLNDYGLTNTVCRCLLVWLPLIAMPLMFNLRWSGLLAPNEEPKWGVFVLTAACMTLAGVIWMVDRRRSLVCGNMPADSAPRFSLPGLLFALFCIGLATGVLYATNTSEGLIRLSFWYSGAIVFLTSAWAMRSIPNYPCRLQWALVVSALFLCSHFWYTFLVDFPDPDFDKRTRFSRIGHFNFTSDVLVILIPFLTWAVLANTTPVKRLLAGFCLATTLFMLVLSGSLGGMGGGLGGALMAGGIGVCHRIIHKKTWGYRPSRRTILIAGGSLILLVVSGNALIQQAPESLRSGIFLRGEWWDAPSATKIDQSQSLPPLIPLWKFVLPYLGSRTPMWAATSGMVAERPWRGFGTGSFETEYPAFSKRYDLFGDFETLGIRIKTNPHNVLLQIASENGLPMMLLFTALLGWLIYQVMRQAWRQPNAFWLCGVWAIWAAALDAQFNHVFFNPASLYMAAIGLGSLLGRLPSESKRQISSMRSHTLSIFVPVLLGAAMTWLSFHTLCWLVSEYYVVLGQRLSASSSPAAAQLTHRAWSSALAWSPDNTNALFGLAQVFYPGHLGPSQYKAMYGTQSIHHQDKMSENEKFQLLQFQFLKLYPSPFNSGDLYSAQEHLQHFLRLSPHHCAGLNLLGTLQARLGQLDEAKVTLTRALLLEPDAKTIKENLEEVERLQKAQAG